MAFIGGKIIEKWSLSYKFGYVDHEREVASEREENVRSIAKSEPEVEMRCVGVPGNFKSKRSKYI